MGYNYTQIDGQRVEVNVAAAFKRLAAAFKAETGCTLHVRSGTRTRAEQQRLYDGWIKRLPGFNLAAKPGTSNHEESGPRGPRALDFYDSGKDAGVTSIGSHRSNVLVRLAPKFGFTNAGHRFTPREGWHYEYTGNIGGPAPASTGSQVVRDVQHAMNVWYNAGLVVDGINGPATKRAILNAQKALRAEGLYNGPLDGIWGPLTNTALNRHRDKVNAAKPKPAAPARLVKRGSKGDLVKKVQAKLKANYPLYAGKLAVDGIYGPGTEAAVKEFQRRSGLTVDGIAGPATLRKLGI
ncbi:lysin A [Microbacterium phage IAmGroot]|uniref:Lysin A n=1 Tax=Microbacterium phage IAmGroot TaxID=2588486 RepID=A0A4Y6E8W9_9CAUD|nr:lysin A [Microbacterium phage IAmGroot]